LFALSTCQWCHKTKELLEELGCAFDYDYVDLLEGKEQNAALDVMEKWSPNGAFPTIVIDNKRVILGFREKEIREALAG
jgi:glutaredoxin-like protein NrdH